MVAPPHPCTGISTIFIVDFRFLPRCRRWRQPSWQRTWRCSWSTRNLSLRRSRSLWLRTELPERGRAATWNEPKYVAFWVFTAGHHVSCLFYTTGSSDVLQEDLSRLRRKLEKQKKVEMYTDADEILQEEINQYKVREKESYIVIILTSFRGKDVTNTPLNIWHSSRPPAVNKAIKASWACNQLSWRIQHLCYLLDFQAVCEFNLPRNSPERSLLKPQLVTVAL